MNIICLDFKKDFKPRTALRVTSEIVKYWNNRFTLVMVPLILSLCYQIVSIDEVSMFFLLLQECLREVFGASSIHYIY